MLNVAHVEKSENPRYALLVVLLLLAFCLCYALLVVLLLLALRLPGEVAHSDKNGFYIRRLQRDSSDERNRVG